MSDYDLTEKVERTDVGFRYSVESTRGTGTRDQDKVKAELRTERLARFEEVEAVRERVKRTMEDLRAFHPDEADDE